MLEWREEQSLERAYQTHPAGTDVVRAWIETVGSNTDRFALVELDVVLSAKAISDDSPAHDYLKDFYRRGNRLLTRAFERVASHGELNAGIVPHTAARLLLSTTPGLQAMWLRDRSINIARDLRIQVQGLMTIDL